jgi:aminocarboxymuconate-semialdehyde decarboxylase
MDTDCEPAERPALSAPGSPPVIDTHVHALPAALLAELIEHEVDGVTATKVDGGWLVALPGAGTKLVRPLMVDADKRAARAAALGLTGQIVSPWLDAQPTPGMADEIARDWARRLNSALREQEPDAGALATVALTTHAALDLATAVDRDGMAGLILSTNPVGVSELASPALEALWEAAAGLGIPVVLHPPTDGPSHALPDSADFGNTFCRLVDTTFAVAKLLLSGVLDRHPTLRLVVVHGGGFLPYQSMRLDGGHRADALQHFTIAREHPSDYLRDLHFDTVALSADSIRFLVDTVGADRVVLGSDYPFPLGDRTPVQTVRAAGLPDTDTAAVLGRNAERLFAAPARSLHA